MNILKSTLLFASALFMTHLAQANLKAMQERIPTIVKLKDSKIIGEQPDGLLGLIKEDPEATVVIEEENRDRLLEYTKRSTEQGQPLEVFMKVLGEARIKKEKTGRMIKDADGKWVLKK
jgi:uncharacterized protein YdbL (DUF1318 family)